MHFTDKSQPGKQLKGTVDSDQPYTGISLIRFFIYFSRDQMAMATGNGIQYCPSLTGKLITPQLQNICYFLPFNHNP
jgi:hypothetical protein